MNQPQNMNQTSQTNQTQQISKILTAWEERDAKQSRTWRSVMVAAIGSTMIALLIFSGHVSMDGFLEVLIVFWFLALIGVSAMMWLDSRRHKLNLTLYRTSEGRQGRLDNQDNSHPDA
jgi:hypothetical protein